MPKITLNIDVGERGPKDPTDHALLSYADQINIALGGHAGSKDIARDLWHRAQDRGIQSCIHPGYPDPDNFGRIPLSIPWPSLRDALNRQADVLPEEGVCKLHGALYNQADADPTLAAKLLTWFTERGIHTVLTPPGGALASALASSAISIVAEGFADRGYILDAADRPVLTPRQHQGAVLEDAASVEQQVRSLINGRAPLVGGGYAFLKVRTLCIHGDGDGAIKRARAVREVLDQ